MLLFTRLLAAQGGVHRQDWLGPHVGAVAFFCDCTKIHALESAIEADEEVPIEPLQDIVSTRLGAALYEVEGKSLEWNNYEKAIKHGLTDLHWHMYVIDEVSRM